MQVLFPLFNCKNMCFHLLLFVEEFSVMCTAYLFYPVQDSKASKQTVQCSKNMDMCRQLYYLIIMLSLGFIYKDHVISGIVL